MGVYIKGIEIPKENELIYLVINNDGIVECVKSIAGSRDGEIPTTLVEMEQTKATYILEPHGRLIDADVLSKKLCETTIFIKDGEVFQRIINDAPTVIERSK